MKKIIIIVSVILVVIIAGAFFIQQKEVVENLPTAKVYKSNVDLVNATTKKVSEKRSFLAQLLASKSALIASKFSADINEIFVKENDIVKKGACLVSLDAAETKANIASSKKQKHALSLEVANAKKSLNRNKKLLEVEAISQEKYDNAQVLYQNKLASLDSINAKIKQLQAQLNYLNISAPFSGRVGTIFVDAGNLAVPGKAIISLNSDDQKLLFSYVETSQSIIEGQSVFIGEDEVGVVKRRYDDAKNSMLVAEVKITKSLPYANMSYLNIDVVVAEEIGCSVPLNSLVHRKDGVVVMEYKDEHFTAFKTAVILQDSEDAILSECPSHPIARGSEAKLSLLPTLGNILLTQDD